MKLGVLIAGILITLFMSLKNWYEEGHYQYFLEANLGAISSGVLVIVIARTVSLRFPKYKKPFIFSAYLAVIFGLVFYTYYAFNGQAENSSESSAQMHILVFPITHLVLTSVLLGLAVIYSFILQLVGTENA